MNVEQIVTELKRERDDLDRAIAALEGIGKKHPQVRKISAEPSTAKISKRRSGISAAGRRRISEAMKKRWQQRRAKVSAIRKPSKAA